MMAVATEGESRCERECRVNNQYEGLWTTPYDGEKILERCHNEV